MPTQTPSGTVSCLGRQLGLFYCRRDPEDQVDPILQACTENRSSEYWAHYKQTTHLLG